jgi:hypothetical protein
MQRIILRILFSSESEIPFIKMHVRESAGIADAVIVYEANRTHTGEPRDFLFPACRAQLSPEILERIIYVPDDVSGVTVESVEPGPMHENERLFRSRFAGLIDLRPDDVVLALDADEIIRREVYPMLLGRLESVPLWRLPLHQFYYRMNYLWTDLTFLGPVACVASHYLRQPSPVWRDEGRIFPVICGAHFSWQLTIDQMVHKLRTYAHRDLYGHLAKHDVLEAAVREKRYPFEPDRPFNIRELDLQADAAYYPASFFEYIADFRQLLPG